MSPRDTRRRGERATRGSTGRRRGRAAGIVVGALALVGLGVIVGVVAVMFGLIPGFGIRRVSNGPVAESARADSAAASQAVARPADTATRPAAIPPLDSAGAPLAAAAMVTPADSAAGEVVYRGAGRCLSCHGAAGEGVAQLGPSLRDERWIVGDGSLAAIARTVREGIAPPKEFPIAMPAYSSQLPEDAINRVAAYVYALAHAGAVQRDSLAPRPDSARAPAPNAQPPVPRPTVPAPEGWAPR